MFLDKFAPLLEEQDQIVRYLDWRVSRINKLISARKANCLAEDKSRQLSMKP